MKNDELDKFIFQNLEKEELDIPIVVQSTVRQLVAALAEQPRQSFRRIKIWMPLLAAAVLVIVVSLPLLFAPKPAMKKISQIRTEFSISDKNIKIIWVQRDDFNFPDSNR